MRYSLALACTMMATPLAAENTRVVTDISVTHALVSKVMGEVGAPGLLLDQGGDPHSFQLRPSQARDLAEADLIFWVGEDLTPWLARALSGVEARGHVVTLLEADSLHLQGFADGHGHDDHGHDDDDHGHDDHGHDDHGHDDHGHDDHGHDDHGHDDHGHEDAGHDDHDHSHDGTDPHAWMNTGNVQVWLDLIAAELAEHDPANAETYRANAAAARDEVAALHEEVESILAPVGDAPLIVFHDAYGYLAQQFGLNIAGTIALGDAASPGAQRLGELRAQLHDAGATCIFPEVNHSSRYVDVVVEGTGVRVGAELDPAGAMLEPGPDLYAALMRNMANAIAECVAG